MKIAKRFSEKRRRLTRDRQESRRRAERRLLRLQEILKKGVTLVAPKESYLLGAPKPRNRALFMRLREKKGIDKFSIKGIDKVSILGPSPIITPPPSPKKKSTSIATDKMNGALAIDKQ